MGELKSTPREKKRLHEEKNLSSDEVGALVEGKMMGRWDNVCIMQPDRKKGKSDGNHVWTDEVSVIVQCVYRQE